MQVIDISLVANKRACTRCLYIVAGQQLCRQVRNREASGEILLGSFLLEAASRAGIDVDILFVAEDMKLGEINTRLSRKECQVNREVMEHVGVSYDEVYYVNGHLVPIQLIVEHMRALNPHVQVTEIQHGWLAGKDIFKRHCKGGLPDRFIAWDYVSLRYLEERAIRHGVKLELAGDLLMLLQISQWQARNRERARVETERKEVNVLLCMSDRDLELGYITKDDCHERDGLLEPKVVYDLIKEIEKIKPVKIERRAKPHDVKGSDARSSLVSQIHESDLVVSCISTVSIQAHRYMGKRSFWYYRHRTGITEVLQQSYSHVTLLDERVGIRELAQQITKMSPVRSLHEDRQWVEKSVERCIGIIFCRRI